MDTALELRDMPADGFGVAFSFAGEQRELVADIAQECDNLLGENSVFYDEWYPHVLGGFTSDMFLQQVYGSQTQMIVMCVSGQYGKKPWTMAEHSAIMARVMELRVSEDPRDRLRFFPIRVGDGEVPGVHKNDIVLDARDPGRTPPVMAQIIARRLRMIDEGRVPPQNPRATVLVLPCTGELEPLSKSLMLWLEGENVAVLRPNPLLPETQRHDFIRQALKNCAVVVEWFQQADLPVDLDFVKCHDEALALNAALPVAQRRPALMWLPPNDGTAADAASAGTSGKRMLFEQFKKTVLDAALSPPGHGVRKVVISAARADQLAVQQLLQSLPPTRPRDAQFDEFHQAPDFKTMPDLDERLHRAIRKRTGSLVVVNGLCHPRWLEERLRAFDYFRENMPQAPRLVVWDVPQQVPKPPLEFLPEEAVTVTSADPAPVAEEISKDAVEGECA